jgi:hypothetical protein
MLSRGNEVANRTNLVRRMSPELALFGHGAMSDASPECASDRTSLPASIRASLASSRTLADLDFRVVDVREHFVQVAHVEPLKVC